MKIITYVLSLVGLLLAGNQTQGCEKQNESPQPRFSFNLSNNEKDDLKVLKTRFTKIVKNPSHDDLLPLSGIRSGQHFDLVVSACPQHFISAQSRDEKWAIYKANMLKDLGIILQQDVYTAYAWIITQYPEISKKINEIKLLDYLACSKFLKDNHGDIVQEYLCKLQYQPRSRVKDLAIMALWIDHIVQIYGAGSVLFPGRTPCLVQLAYEELLKYKYNDSQESLNQKCKRLSFSGTPDAICFRESNDFKNDDINTRRHFVNEDRLKFYMSYLESLGIGKMREKLYIVDIIGKGVSLNSFARILRYFYIRHLGLTKMPDLHFIGMGLSHGQDRVASKSNGDVIFKYDSKAKVITFDDHRRDGIWPMSIPATSLNMSQTTETFLDESRYQDLMFPAIYFPPFKWNESSREELEKGAPFSVPSVGLVRDLLQPVVKTLQDEVAKVIASSSQP